MDDKLKKYIEKGYAIHCETLNDAEELLTWLDANGYKWCNGVRYIEEHNYFKYGENTTYLPCEGSYCSKGHFLNENFSIINFKEIRENNKNKKEMKQIKVFHTFKYDEEREITLCVVTHTDGVKWSVPKVGYSVRLVRHDEPDVEIGKRISLDRALSEKTDLLYLNGSEDYLNKYALGSVFAQSKSILLKIAYLFMRMILQGDLKIKGIEKNKLKTDKVINLTTEYQKLDEEEKKFFKNLING